MSDDDLIRINIQSDVRKLHCKARELKMLRTITNEILSNCSYSQTNIEQQEKRFDETGVPNEHRKIIKDAWQLKYKLGLQLMNDLKLVIDKYDIKTEELKIALTPTNNKSINEITIEYKKQIMDKCFDELENTT